MEDLSEYLNKSISYKGIEYYVHKCYSINSKVKPFGVDYYLYASEIYSNDIKIEIPEFVPIIQSDDYIYSLEVKTVSSFIFESNRHVESITFPKSISTYDEMLFTRHCDFLKEIIIKENFCLNYKFNNFSRCIKFESSVNTLNNLKLIKFNNISLIKENDKWRIKR